jgi:hypothetical protein
MKVEAHVYQPLRVFRENTDWLFTDRFEEMIQTIERHPGTIALAKRIEGLMREAYEEMTNVSQPESLRQTVNRC